MADTLAYVNWGRVVAHCGEPNCHDAGELAPGQQQMICVGGHVSTVKWPPNMPAILAVLGKRADESKRNWFPAGHPMAIAGNFPTDQSPVELEAEQADNEQADAERSARRDKAAAALHELGVDAADLRALLANGQ
jgi:hypothetical protein